MDYTAFVITVENDVFVAIHLYDIDLIGKAYIFMAFLVPLVVDVTLTTPDNQRKGEQQ